MASSASLEKTEPVGFEGLLIIIPLVFPVTCFLRTSISRSKSFSSVKGTITGVYVRSGKPGQFFAGGDITAMMEMDLNPDQAERERLFRGLLEAKAPLRRLEALGVPVAHGEYPMGHEISQEVVRDLDGWLALNAFDVETG